MRVYAESNFVLELVLEQEDHGACSALLTLAESTSIDLVLPAFALFEPFTTLFRTKKDLEHLTKEVKTRLDAIARTASLRSAAQSNDITELMARSVQQAELRFREVRSRLVAAASLLPLTADTMRGADRLVDEYGLTLPDALVLASVLADPEFGATPSCFLNRNHRDFDDPTIVARLGDCRLITRFADGLDFVRSRLDRG